MVRFRLLIVWLAACIAASAAEKRPLTLADLDGWRSLDTPRLSRDGRWLAYADMPQVDDGQLVLRDLVTGREFRTAVGARPPAPFPPPRANNPDDPPPPRDIRIALTGDNRFAVTSTFPTRTEMVAARKQRKKTDELPKNGLLTLNLVTSEAIRISAVKSFQIPARGGAWVAYLKEAAPKADADAQISKSRRPPNPHQTVANARAAAPKKKPVYGTDLVLRNLNTGAERVFAHVVEYSFARDGRTLLFTVSSRTEHDNGVYAFTPGASKPIALLAGPGQYLRLAWDRPQSQAAFVSDRADHAAAEPRFLAYHWQRGAKAATVVTAALPAVLYVSDKTAPVFSHDGKKLYLGVAPTPAREPDPEADTDPEDKVTADLWRSQDDFVQPMQEARAPQERNRSYRGVFDLATGAYTQLADGTLPTVTLSDDGRRALGYDDRPHRRRVEYDSYYSDLYLVDAATGQRRLLQEGLRGSTYGGPSLAWSPDGQWASYYEDGRWRVLDTASGKSHDLTGGLPVAFAKEDHDMPEPPPSYSWAGWTSDSSSILVYDRYDVWQLFPDGRPARNLTQGAGRFTKTILRVQDVTAREEDDEDRGIDPAKPLTLRGESEETRASGFFRTTFDATGAPQRLLWGDCNYTYAGRALDADVLIITASRFDLFPDIQTTSESFARPVKVTDLGAQLAPFKWGSAELMNYRNADGVELQAMVVKPADFDPAKKYPLIVYYYERLSQIVHRFNPPVPGHNINFPFYASNGYLLLLPDIVYKEGQPGRSALKCVLPAVDALVARGFVNEKAIGTQGHSWGAYQVAYLITQTNRFCAAAAGSVVGNMTSAYGGIRWGAGLPRLFQYEKNQSRIGPPLTDAPEIYLENSPVFHVKNVQTPLLLLHNDQDDAVPWEQGIELFLALRRHGKPVWFFNYNQERHWLLRRADQKDYTLRMWQFFDHYLRGAPAPAWMSQGIPYLDREAEKVRINEHP
jgi:dipeptidyl aminopeptidase/acylaminoacyl peptidase